MTKEVAVDTTILPVEQEVARRTQIKSFVKDQLVAGTDFVNIKGKDTLAKPGMEKILSLFSLKSRLFKDEETLSMVTSKDLIAYRCELYRTHSSDGHEEIMAEGRGSCSVSEKRGDVNTTIKIAEKRARMDACLTLGFSEYFTQDLDDMNTDHIEPAATKSYEAREKAPSKPDEDPLADGDHTVVIEDERSGKTGDREWQRVKTDKGSAWNNSGVHMEVGEQYSVNVLGGSINTVNNGEPFPPDEVDINHLF